MANSFVRYTGNGNTTQFAIPFTYIDSAHLSCTVAGVNTSFTLNAAGTTATLSSPPANGVAIEFRRKTSQTSRLTDYQSGSVLKEEDLDTDSIQSFNMSQEAIDDAGDVIKLDNVDFQWDTQNKRLKNVADPTANTDAATKNYLENTWLSTTDKATLTNVNNNIAAINTVNSNISDIQQTNSNATNINTVATNIGSVNTVATDITKVVAVANDLAEAVSEVETVADDLNEATSEIDTVANNITNVNLVGNDIANVNTVAGISANVTTVANNNANVTTAATNNANITSVAGNATNINTVAGSITNVNNVGNDIANVNSVASNLSGVNSFAERYRILSSAPSTSNDVGDLYFDTSANELKVYKSSGWAAAGSTVNGTANRFEYTATANQTTFSGADSNGATMAYDAGFIDVYLNGVKLAGADYTATTGTSVVLASGASVNDILMVVAYGTFQLANISINDLTDTPAAVGSAGQALVVNAAGNALEYSNASSAEVYGFHRDNNGNLIVTTTNQGADNISASDYANFADVLYAASGFTWSINNGELIATI